MTAPAPTEPKKNEAAPVDDIPAIPAALVPNGERPFPADIKLRHETAVEKPLEWRYERKTLSDHFAYAACKGFKFFADAFFKHRYAHRSVVLETVAAVPGMVGAAFNHFRSLRGLKEDNGRIRMLLDEAENERMHLMTFLEIAKPTKLERALISAGQAMFVAFFSLAYVFNKRTAHRFVGLIEEEAITSYDKYLAAIDKGEVKNIDAPEFARKYWNLPKDAKLRDVVVAVRNDEAEHRDVNHRLANELDQKRKERQEEKARAKAEKQARKKAKEKTPPAPKPAQQPA
jgi:ubiquinol oxidase